MGWQEEYQKPQEEISADDQSKMEIIQHKIITLSKTLKTMEQHMIDDLRAENYTLKNIIESNGLSSCIPTQKGEYMDLQEQLEVGHQAEDFKKYIDEHPYFNGLIERMRLEYAKMLMELPPTATEEFTNYRQSMDAIAGILNAVSGDIYMGQQAYEKLNGLSEEPKGGLL